MKKTISSIAILAAMICLAPFAEAQNPVGQGLKNLGRKFKDAASETFNDAVNAVSESTGNQKGGKAAGDKSSSQVAEGPTYYVSIEDGSNRNEGTSKDAPLKNIQKAVDIAPEGAVILVAGGNYFGLLNSGNINITKPVSIYGGYSSDFSERDVLRYRTTVCPSGESNGSQNGQGTMQVKVRKPGSTVVVDGILFDRGNSVAYDSKHEGQPEGVESPMMLPVGIKGIGGKNLDEEVQTAETAIIYLDRIQADITIRNCSFVNAPSYGIRGMVDGKATVENCVFVNVRLAAAEIGGCNALKNGVVEFKNNTVLFVWSRLRDKVEMGYGFRYMTKVDCYLDKNIFGLAEFSALDRTAVDIIPAKESERVTTVENSIFFRNGYADITLPGGESNLKVKAQDFEDVNQLAKVAGNVTVVDPAVFNGRLDQAYLDGFLKASMYANRYPFEEALELFGAVDDYGAQLIR